MQQDFYVGDALVQPRLNTIERHGETTRVKPRSMAVLVCLAEAQGEVVEKYALMDAVWGQASVTEDVLTQSIVELRKAFGDRANRPTFIETIRKVGFRLLPPVKSADSKRGGSLFAELRRRVSRPALLGAASVAVLLAGAVAFLVLDDRGRAAAARLPIRPSLYCPSSTSATNPAPTTSPTACPKKCSIRSR